MRVTRCYLPPPLQAHTELALPEATAQHLVRVLRLRVGAELTVFDGRGGEYAAELLRVDRDRARIGIGAHRPIERESPMRILLLQSLARGERMDLIVQKATELGVETLVPLSSRHSVVRLETSTAKQRGAHWRLVAIGACEQCGRNRIPNIAEVMDVASACSTLQLPAQRLLLSPDASASLSAALRPEAPVSEPERGGVALLIGPEGGWSEDELALAQRSGFRPVRLGPRVLRTETAPLAALAIVQALCGDLR